MLHHRGARLPWGPLTLVFFEANGWGSVTIGRVGELFRAPPLIARGVPRRVAIASVLLDRALDLGFLVSVGLASLAWATGRPWLATLVGVATVGVLLGVAAAGKRRALLDEMPRSRARLAWEEARAFFHPTALVEVGGWTVLGWALSFAIVVMVADALAPQARVVTLLAAAFVSSLSTLLPITYQGVGTREPIFAALLSGDGVSAERAVVVALVVFTVNLAVALLLGVVAGLWRARTVNA
jgi:uncharacterized membrane protein YbhN (UPF0104 family)